MESVYDRPITLEEELRMKHEAVKGLESLGYTMNKKGEEILVFYGEDKVGRLISSKEEDAPLAVVERQNFNTLNSTGILDVGQKRRAFKETLLDLGWAVSSYDKVPY